MIAVKEYLRPAYRAVRKRVQQLDRAMDRRVLAKSEFEALLALLGVTQGATVLAHSSMDALARRVPGLTPVELIRMLQALLTESGTLLMPTFPFRGRQVRYVEKTDRFDPRRTPSQSGLVTEVFRRMPGVVRSLHPTHPIAGWGANAAVLLATHHLGGAFGVTSPIYRLREFGGVVVGLGTGLRDSFTILHVPEEIHPKAQQHFFETEVRMMKVVDGEREIAYPLTALRGDVHRNYDRVERALVREGVVRSISAKGLRCAVTPAEAFIDRCMRMVDEGKYL